MADTYLQMINRVLTELGEGDNLVDTNATSISDVAHLKIAQFVNNILQEVEDAAQWRSLRTRDTVTISANALSGSLASANERSRVFQVVDPDNGQLLPLVFDVTDTNNQARLAEIDLAELLYLDQQNSNVSTTSGIGGYYALSPTATGMDIYVFPRLTSARDVEIDMIIPQGPLDPTSNSSTTGLQTVIKVPNMAVQFGSVWWAMEDRGEELGMRGDKAEARYRNRLADYVASELDAQGMNDLVPS